MTGAFPAGMVDALDPVRLRLLVEVGRLGSVSAAAEACRMGQPSASRHLKTLEAVVGVKLVERDGRASRLTDAGRVVARHGARVLDTFQAMDEELRTLHGAQPGTLALAASSTPGAYVLPSILRCFAGRHPGVDVDVAIGSSRWVAERVAGRSAHLGLAGDVALPDGVVAEPFLEDEIVGIAAPGTLPAHHGRVPAAALAGQTLLVREEGSSTRAVAERALARAGYRAEHRWELESSEAIKRSVAAGFGIGFVSRRVVEDELDDGRLTSFVVEGAGSMRRSVHLLRPDGRDFTATERRFVQTLGSCCAVSIAGCVVEPAATA